MCIILRSFSKVLCRNLQFSFLLFAIIVCCSYCSYFLDSLVSLVTIVALLLFWFILFAHLEFALNVSMVIFCGRAMEGAGNASHRAGPGWIQQASTGDRTHDMRFSTCAPRMLGGHMLHCLPATLGEGAGKRPARTPSGRPAGLSCICSEGS